jgi:hypothetical protein
VTVLFSWGETDTTSIMTMLTLFGQTANERNAESSVNIARSSVIPTLFRYTRADGTIITFSGTYGLSSGDVNDLRDREILNVTIYMDGSDVFTTGLFDYSQATTSRAVVELFTTIFFLIVWVVGVASFVGPVMTLVSTE